MDPKKTKAWIMYDWANSAFATTMMAAVLPIFYSSYAGANLEKNVATAYWGYTDFVATLIIALLSPVLGAAADLSGRKVRSVQVFSYLGMLSCLLFVFVGKGDYLLASVLFVIGVVGFAGGNTFYDSLLGDVAPPGKRDMVSSQGYAYGYIGGGILLAINLVMIEKPELFGFPDKTFGTKAAFVSVAVWWFIFSQPLFRRLKDRPDATGRSFAAYVRLGTAQTWNTLKGIMKYRELLKFMIAFWFFNDGISTIIKMATIYGAEIGIDTTALILALLITQFVGIPFTLLFGRISEKIGSMRTLVITLFVYVLIVILGYFMNASWQFYLLAIMVGFVQGGSQAISRSIFSRLVPPKQSSEFFGFLSISSKFTSLLGPLVFGIVAQTAGSSRLSILAVLVFFVVGLVLLRFVNLDQGMKEAEA